MDVDAMCLVFVSANVSVVVCGAIGACVSNSL